jgi:ribosome-associated toxin RatA of RatAB toxin-antitoxin module
MAHEGTSTIHIEATPAELMAIVADLEAYPDWLEDVKEVEILEHGSDGMPAASRMTVDVSIRVVSYELDYEYDGDNRMAWVSRPGGDVRHIEGSYAFEPDEDGGTIATYTLAVDPGFPVPGFLLKRVAKHVTAQALDGLKARAEDV